MAVAEACRQAVGNKRPSAALVVDLRRAFDSVRADLLLYKFRRKGFTLAALNLLSSYSTDRSQVVDIGGTFSTDMPVLAGVPQGSCLGPLAFLAFIDDMGRNFIGSSIKYADDTSFVYHASNYSELHSNISRDVVSITKWCSDNMISINEKKTQIIVFKNPTSPRPHLDDIFMEGVAVSRVEYAKLLGIQLDENLSASAHIKQVLCKMARTTFACRYLKNHLGASSALRLYNTYLLPHIIYGMEYWACCSENCLNQVQVAQNYFLRMFRGSASREISEHKILVISELIKYNNLTFLYKQIHGIGPQIFDLKFIHQGAGRDQTIFVIKVPFASTSHGAKGLIKMISEWNALPTNIRIAVNIKTFKSMLKLYLLRN